MSTRAERLLDALDAALHGISVGVELSAQTSRVGTTRLAGSRVTQSGEVEDALVQARVAVGRQIGTARTSALDRAALTALIDRARQLAQLQPDQIGFDGFADGSLPTPSIAPRWHEATALADAGTRTALLEPTLTLARDSGLTVSGLAANVDTAVAVATTNGARRAHGYTSARVDLIASDAETSGFAGHHSHALDSIDARALAQTACDKAARWRGPVELAPAAYDVILEPAALAEALEWLAVIGLGARSIEDGSSPLAGRLGTKITGDVTLYDDPLAGEDGCPTQPFDSEGTPCQRMQLVEQGVARAVAHDRASAARAGLHSTGHAAPLGDEASDGGPLPQHLHLAAGSDETARMVEQIERGLWVTRFHYVNGLLDPRRALMTGMTRDGLFLIDQGRITRGVRNLRWTESLIEALSRLAGSSRQRSVVGSSSSGLTVVCPTVWVRQWRFTGTSR